MLFQYLSEDQNVIQVYYYSIFYYEVLKDVVHYSLESSLIIPKNITRDSKSPQFI